MYASKVQASGRDPYPYPLYENDHTFQGGVCQRKQEYGIGDHLMGQKDPWVRLNKTPTLTSARKEVYHYDQQAPNDSLDFTIKAAYDQHEELFKSSAEVRFQKETLGNPEGRRLKGQHLVSSNMNFNNSGGRVLKNREVVIPKPAPPLNHPIKYAEQKEKKSKNQVKGAISGHHDEIPNRGYSRKIDGGYFL